MKNAFSIFIIGLFFSAYYVGLGYYEYSLGFKYLEPLFMSDRLQLLFTNDIKTLELFYFTYPVISQLITIPAGLIDPLLAPMITSGITVGFFAAYIVVILFKQKLPIVSVIITLYFLCSPVIISVATSGTSLYLYLILYYFFFHFLFRYTRDFTTYNFVILSLCLTLFVFLNYSFLWMVVFMLPLIFLFSLFNSPGIQKSYLGIFTELTQSRVTARELVGSSLSTVLVIVFTPLVSLLFFLTINYWFTGDFMFFSTTKTASWDQHPFLDFVFYNTSENFIDLGTSWDYLSISILALSPVFLTAFLIGRKKLLFQLIMLLVPVWILYSKNSNSAVLLSLSDFLIITAAGIAAFIHFFHTSLLPVFSKSKVLHLITFILLLINLGGEYFYFTHTYTNQEQNMLAFLKQEKPLNSDATADMADFINKNLPKDATILTDNTLFYPTIALSRDHVKYVDQFDPNYYNALQAPQVHADYILILNNSKQRDQKDGVKYVVDQTDIELQTQYTNTLFSLIQIKK